MFHKEGNTIIFTTLVSCIALALLVEFSITNPTIRYLLFGLLLVLLFLILQFFRNPKRDFNPNESVILSPVDGKVVVIEEVFEPEYFREKRLQVSIFMSPVNVHVTRYPAAGRIVYSKYHPGKYLVAWHPKSSEENERTTVVIKTSEFGDVLYRQIAGAMARRIVNYAVEGQEVGQAADSGFIKFGSRVDVFLPLDAKIRVNLEQKVKGGLTAIASRT
jgi:phosphatidylserine decarboxylase